MNESLTAPQAQEKIYAYMRETLGELPAGAALSKVPDNTELGVRRSLRPNAVPCWDGNIQSSGPRYLSVHYWITGLPAGSVQQYYDQIGASWKAKGWEIQTMGTDVIKASIPDGFGLKVQDAGKGDGSLSLAGYSPCIPESTIDQLANNPETIPRP
ncbi:hypothetical protein [Nocardia camponoti]|uniref:hypothetical protein n=1 Tax=Nocardia camponoti TaxID=1616106 RepID=UPI001667A849|nr:hypothetical protein [Nocardia camponoti]